MPVLNDFGPEAYQRAVAQMDALAARLGIQKEIIYQYWNDTAHLPQSIAELEAWGNKPNQNYPAFTPRSPGGAWNVLRPGDTPGTRGAANPGFRHVITNEVDKPQRFQQVDEQGNIFGGSWNPAANAAHPEWAGRPAFDPTRTGQPATQSALGGTQRSAQARSFDDRNYVAPQAGGFVSVVDGVPNQFMTQQEAEQDFNTRTGGGATAPGAAPPAPAAPAGPAPATGTAPPTGTPGQAPPTSSGLGPLIDANVEGNTRRLQAEIDDALRRYATARNQEERNQAYLDLQRWKQELDKVQGQQKTVADMAASILSAATTLGSRPADYVQANQITSGGRDILDQISGKGGPVAAFGAPTGQVQPGSIWDLLGRLGLQFPQTPATPAGVQPGAPNPSLPGVPAVPVPGAPGTTTPAAGTTDALPASLAQALAELDRAAGGSWTGNRADKATVAREWWRANPARRDTPVPTPNW